MRGIGGRFQKMHGFLPAVGCPQRHHNCVGSVAAGDDRYIGIVDDLVDNLLKPMAGLGEADGAHGDMSFVLCKTRGCLAIPRGALVAILEGAVPRALRYSVMPRRSAVGRLSPFAPIPAAEDRGRGKTYNGDIQRFPTEAPDGETQLCVREAPARSGKESQEGGKAPPQDRRAEESGSYGQPGTRWIDAGERGEDRFLDPATLSGRA